MPAVISLDLQRLHFAWGDELRQFHLEGRLGAVDVADLRAIQKYFATPWATAPNRSLTDCCAAAGGSSGGVPVRRARSPSHPS